MIIPVMGILLPMVLVPTVVILTQLQKRRAWKHEERLNAMRMGLPVRSHEPRIGGGTVVALGSLVPIASVFAALMVTLGLPTESRWYEDVVIGVWVCTGFLSTLAIAGSLVLAFLLIRADRSIDQRVGLTSVKPEFDPEAFDVVSRRG
mgnify:CR=1 FL=1